MPPRRPKRRRTIPFIEFCKNGDLKATSDWIAKGNPLDLPPGKKTRRAGPLQIAIEKGFLTLTETLRDAGTDPSSNRLFQCTKLTFKQCLRIAQIWRTEVAHGPVESD